MPSAQPECAALAYAASGNGSSSRFLDALGIGPEITGRVKLPPLSALETPIKAPLTGPNAFFELAAQSDDLPETPLAGDFPTLESLTVPVPAPAPVPVLVPVPMTKPAPIATLVPKSPAPAPAAKPLAPVIAEAPPLPEPVKPAAPTPAAPVAAVAELLYLGCPVCKSELTLGAEFVGVQGACPSCQTPIVAYRESDTVVRLMVLTAKPPMPTAPRPQPVAAAPKR